MFGVRKACRELAEWCHETQQENDRLKAENAKLREELEAAKHDLQVFSANLARLGAENARLVDVLHEVEEEAVLAFNSLRQDCKTITDSSQHFFEKWWHAECEADRLKAENAKLRELVRHMYECMGNIDADGNHECDSCEYDNEEGKCDYERRMRELGIGVNE